MELEKEKIKLYGWRVIRFFIAPMTIALAPFYASYSGVAVLTEVVSTVFDYVEFLDFIPFFRHLLIAVFFIPCMLAAQFPVAAAGMAIPLGIVMDMDLVPFFLYVLTACVKKPDLHWFDPKGTPRDEIEIEHLKSSPGIPFRFALLFNLGLICYGLFIYPPMEFAPGLIISLFLIFFLIFVVRGNGIVRSFFRCLLWTAGIVIIAFAILIAIMLITEEGANI